MFDSKFYIALCIALVIDALDVLIGWIPIIGQAFSTILGIIGIMLLLPFIGIWAIAGVLELIPFVNWLPTFTAAVLAWKFTGGDGFKEIGK